MSILCYQQWKNQIKMLLLLWKSVAAVWMLFWRVNNFPETKFSDWKFTTTKKKKRSWKSQLVFFSQLVKCVTARRTNGYDSFDIFLSAKLRNLQSECQSIPLKSEHSNGKLTKRQSQIYFLTCDFPKSPRKMCTMSRKSLPFLTKTQFWKRSKRPCCQRWTAKKVWFLIVLTALDIFDKLDKFCRKNGGYREEATRSQQRNSQP